MAGRTFMVITRLPLAWLEELGDAVRPFNALPSGAFSPMLYFFATSFAPPRARGEAANMVAYRSDPPSPPGGHADAPSGDRRNLDEVFSVAYEELRRLAASVRRRESHVTLNPTALVNEAWIKLASNPKLAQTSLPHFKRIAARAMRQVLVEAARRRSARKRGGPHAVFVTFDESVGAAAWADDVVELDAALERLASLNPRQAQLVESRFFGGLDVPETARLLGVSEATAQRDWRAARAWLSSELRSSA
jgi:RNA polymerase sigma factor (TIGR02999 family)